MLGGDFLNRDSISARQLYVILFAAALSPAVRTLPTWTAGTAGVGAWLTGIAAFPALLLAGWILYTLLKAAPGQGLSEVYETVLGRIAGKGLTIIYIVWGLFRLTLEARLYGVRMVAATGKHTSLPVILLVLLGLALWLGRKKLAAFARASEIFYLVLAVTLGTVLLFSALGVAPENVLPVWVEDLPAIAAASLVPVGTLCFGVFGAFLAGNVTRREGDGTRGVRWLLAGCLVLSALQFGVLAQLGPVLSARMETPFFEVARGVGVTGAFQRVESVVVALWLLSDLALLGLLVFALRTMVRTVFGSRWVKWTPLVAVGLAFFGAVFLLPDDFFAAGPAAAVALMGDVILCIPVPAMVLLVRWGRKRIGERHR